MEFRFDNRKSESNKKKHGIDFFDAQALWDDPDLMEIPAKNVDDEDRFLLIGKINNKYWSAIVTYRDNTIRLISVRRSRDKEVSYYESY